MRIHRRSLLYISSSHVRNPLSFFFFFNDTATTEIYTLSLHDALPIYAGANVSVSFPASLPGVSGIPAGFGTIANPYLKVTVTDPVATYFTRIGSSITTVNVTASAS